MCPYYMAIGMPYVEFWTSSPFLVKAYREAHTYKVRLRNEELYLQGLYNYSAFMSALDSFSYALGGGKGKKPKGYLEKPLDITEKTEAEKRKDAEEERKKAIKSLTAWASAWKEFYGNG